MALFGKDRERIDRPRGLSSEPGVPANGPASGEAEMLERERVQPGETGGTSAFLGKGSHVSGKLQFEGQVVGADFAEPMLRAGLTGHR